MYDPAIIEELNRAYASVPHVWHYEGSWVTNGHVGFVVTSIPSEAKPYERRPSLPSLEETFSNATDAEPLKRVPRLCLPFTPAVAEDVEVTPCKECKKTGDCICPTCKTPHACPECNGNGEFRTVKQEAVEEGGRVVYERADREYIVVHPIYDACLLAGREVYQRQDSHLLVFDNGFPIACVAPILGADLENV